MTAVYDFINQWGAILIITPIMVAMIALAWLGLWLFIKTFIDLWR